MNAPPIKFAVTGDGLRIAYNTWGSGPTLVIVPPIVSNVEMVWEQELYRRVLERLGRHLRVIGFDKRGIGMSDRFDELPTDEQRVMDFMAVMNAESVERAHISGISEGGVMAQIFAAKFPDRIDRLLLSNTSAPSRHRARVAELAEGTLMNREERGRRWGQVIADWGTGSRTSVEWFNPSLADDDPYRAWAARYERQTATQDGFRRQLESVSMLDAGDLPQRISAPTLITHTRGDAVLNIGNARVLAELIPDALLIEFPGADHFFWLAPDWKRIVDTQLEFLIDGPVGSVIQREFAAVLFTDIVGSTSATVEAGDDDWRETLDAHDRTAMRILGDHRGRLIKTTGDGLLATFPSPSLAVEAARALRAQLAETGLGIRAGVHAGEIEIRDDDVTGFAVNLAARVEQAAPDGEILVTSTVRDLLLGGSLAFEDAGSHDLKGFEGSWSLYRLV